ncbi:MAG: hypothetical protein Q9227_002417 [Pyrenula ochraceoflavens]
MVRAGNRKPHTNNRHESGLVGPGKRISKQKSNGHLSGSPKGCSTPDTPPLSPATNTERLPDTTPPEHRNGAVKSPENNCAGPDIQSKCQEAVPGSPRAMQEPCQNGSVQRPLEPRTHRSDTTTSQKRSTGDISVFHLGSTILRSCPTADTVAILILLLQLPASVLTLVQVMFASLTFMPPAGVAFGTFLSPFDLFQGSSGPPSLWTMIAFDLIGLMFWYFCPLPARNYALDLAQIQIAVTLGGGNAASSRSAGYICMALMLVVHLARDPVIKKLFLQNAMSINIFSAENLADLKRMLPTEVSVASLPPSSTWLRTVVSAHIVTQAVTAIVRRNVQRTSPSPPPKPSKKADMEASAGSSATDATSLDSGTPMPSTGVDLPQITTQGRERAVSAKKRRRQANQVRSRQPFWAALASTKVTVMREYEFSKVYRKTSGSQNGETAELNGVDEASFWITDVDSSSIKFGASGINGTDADQPFYVRINGAYWTSFGARNVAETGSTGDSEVWVGEISGLAPNCTYTCTFVQSSDGQDLSVVTVNTPALSDTDNGKFGLTPILPLAKNTALSLAPPAPHQVLRPSSPITTLKGSIAAQESKLQDHRNKLARQKKAHKGIISKLEKEIDSTRFRLESSSNDSRQRQKHQQTQRSLEQAETYASTIDAAIEDISKIPEEELKLWHSQRQAHEEYESAVAAATEEVEKARVSKSRQLAAANNELKTVVARHERLATRQSRLDEQYQRVTQANSQGPTDKERKAVTFVSKEEEFRRREQANQAQISNMQMRLQRYNSMILQANSEIQSMQQAQMMDTGPLTPEGPLPGTIPNPPRNHTNPFSVPFHSPALSSAYPAIPVTMSPDLPHVSPFPNYANPLQFSPRRPRSTSNRSAGARSRFSGDYDDYDPIPPGLQDRDFLGNRKGSGSSKAESNPSPTVKVGKLGSPVAGKTSPGHAGKFGRGLLNDMVKTTEDWLTVEDGTKLYTKAWHTLQPDISPPKAILAAVHGFSDHCNGYHDFFPGLAERGIEVRAYDQRGFGRSLPAPTTPTLTPLLGSSGPTPTVLSDLRSFLSSIPTPSTTPLILYGHSMGGAIVLLYTLLTNPSSSPSFISPPPSHPSSSTSHLKISALIASSPYIALHPSSQPFRVTVLLGRLAARFFPQLTLVQRLDPQWMSRDASVGAAWAADPLCHDTGTLQQLDGMLRRAEWLDRLGQGEQIEGLGSVVRDGTGEAGKEVPVLMLHGEGDRVTSFEASKRVFEKLGNKGKKWIGYPGAYHKLHAETPEVTRAYVEEVAGFVLAQAVGGVDDRKAEDRDTERGCGGEGHRRGDDDGIEKAKL